MKSKANQLKPVNPGLKANASLSGSKNENAFQFKDKRAETASHVQLKKIVNNAQSAIVQRQENKTGLPDNLKSGVESLSGISMNDVKVHYNSSQPAQLNAHAYAQGTDIHLAPGQEKHLPHEAWHVVQQKQGRVQPTMQMKGKVNVNDDKGLEKEADVMGMKAMQMKSYGTAGVSKSVQGNTVQRSVEEDLHTSNEYMNAANHYQGNTFYKIGKYKGKIKALHEQGNDNHYELTSDMANGLKVWSQNYYNKTQAYLYEGQKADDFTNIYSNPSTFAILGSDTDLNADIEVHKEHFDKKTGQSIGFAGGISVELKASTSENYDAVYKLVGEGIDQLKKRELQLNLYQDKFDLLKLVVHNDDPKNFYPFTDEMMRYDYGNNPQNVPGYAWSFRLQNLLKKRIQKLKFTTPVEVILEHNGKRYAVARF